MPSATNTALVTLEDTVDGQPAKRQRLAVTDRANGHAQLQPKPKPQRAKLFAPFRTVGLVSTGTPFSVDPRGKKTFNITTSVGRSLQTYDLRRGLHLIFLTRPQCPNDIHAIANHKDHSLAAWGSLDDEGDNGVCVFKRGQKVGDLERPRRGMETITRLLPLGQWIIGSGKKTVEVWDSTTLEHYTTLHVGQGRKGVQITGGICNMPTYLNKILVGLSDGCVEIWNVSTAKLRYTIFPDRSDMGAVTCVEPTPALSLFAIAYASGELIIHDVLLDKPLISLNAGSEKAPVASISFRTDGLGAGEDGQKEGMMATASRALGDVTFWDLNNGGRKLSVLRGAHLPPSITESGAAGGICKVEFLPGQGVIITSGLDNALKSWIFDEHRYSPTPRPLHARSGHAAPVSRLEFLPPASETSESDGKWLMSASRDRSLWAWSLRRDAQSTELSQGQIQKKAKKAGILNSSLDAEGSRSLEELKAPRITCMAVSLNRDGGMGAMPGTKDIWLAPGNHKKATTAESSLTGWESVVTGHEGDKFARTWFWGRKRAGRWKLQTTDGATVSSVAMSPCGTFAVVASEAGGIDMFNLQSGIKRQRFPAPLTKKQAERLKVQPQVSNMSSKDFEKTFARGQGKHTQAVTGVQVDNLNRTVISCGLDGKVKFWDFAKGTLLHELDWCPISIDGLRYHRSTDLICLSCSDGFLRIVDIMTRKTVRELWASEADNLDFSFSNDGRWVLSVSSDSILRVWDLPTGHLIEAVRLPSTPTALAFSPRGEYLATAHTDSVGVHIWNNRSLFTNVPTRRLDANDVLDISAPLPSGETAESALEVFCSDAPAEDEDEGSSAAPREIEQLSKELLTLSLVPKARWQTLLHLDQIRSRNKPKEAPKPPQKAPFFLPSLEPSKAPSTQQSLDLTALTRNPTSSSRISIIQTGSANPTSEFCTLVLNSPPQAFAHLASLPPSSAALVIQSLSPSPPYNEPIAFIRMLTAQLRERKDYELVQTFLAVFLRFHAGLVGESLGVRDALGEWREVGRAEAARLAGRVGFCRGVGGWISGVV